MKTNSAPRKSPQSAKSKHQFPARWAKPQTIAQTHPSFMRSKKSFQAALTPHQQLKLPPLCFIVKPSLHLLTKCFSCTTHFNKINHDLNDRIRRALCFVLPFLWSHIYSTKKPVQIEKHAKELIFQLTNFLNEKSDSSTLKLLQEHGKWLLDVIERKTAHLLSQISHPQNMQICETQLDIYSDQSATHSAEMVEQTIKRKLSLQAERVNRWKNLEALRSDISRLLRKV